MTEVEETKWFGQNVYRVGMSIVIAAVRPVPGAGIGRRGRGCRHCTDRTSS